MPEIETILSLDRECIKHYNGKYFYAEVVDSSWGFYLWNIYDVTAVVNKLGREKLLQITKADRDKLFSSPARGKTIEMLIKTDEIDRKIKEIA